MKKALFGMIAILAAIVAINLFPSDSQPEPEQDTALSTVQEQPELAIEPAPPSQNLEPVPLPKKQTSNQPAPSQAVASDYSQEPIEVESEEMAQDLNNIFTYLKNKKPKLVTKHYFADGKDYADRAEPAPKDVHFGRLYADYSRRDTEYLTDEKSALEAQQAAQPGDRVTTVRLRAIAKVLAHRQRKLAAFKNLQDIEFVAN